MGGDFWLISDFLDWDKTWFKQHGRFSTRGIFLFPYIGGNKSGLWYQGSNTNLPQI